MASTTEQTNPPSDFDLGRVQSAHMVAGEGVESPANGDSVATDKDTVQVVLSLPRADAERLLKNVESTNTSSGVSAPPSQEDAAKPATRLRTSTRLKTTESPNQSPSQSSTVPRATRSSTSHLAINGTPPVKSASSAASSQQPPPPTSPDVLISPNPVELQGMLDTERSYTNAFHKTLSLFVDDKTFSTPSLRAAVVGFLESSNATVLEILPQHNHQIPEHLKQEIENHVNLIRTVLQRGGVFAEDFLRSRLKKLSTHIPRLEAALAVNDPNRRSHVVNSKAPVLVARSNDPYGMSDLDPATAAATQAALAQAAEAAARSNSRHHQMLAEVHGHGAPDMQQDEEMMDAQQHQHQHHHQQQQQQQQQHPHHPQHDELISMNEMNGYPGGPGVPPGGMGGMPPLPGMTGPGMSSAQMAGMPPLPRGKTFVPPSMVPGQQGPQQLAPRMEEGASPPPVLAPFDPRPNPMACLFCRQRKIRCIGHKPHPCEICVKRGFVCSYDWISRRGKRKPKGSDGSPLDMPSGSVTVAMNEQGGMPGTVGGVPIVGGGPNGNPAMAQMGVGVGGVGVGVGVGMGGGGAGGPPPPVVGMHPHPHGAPPPGMHMPMEGMVSPFTYTFLPGHGPPGGPFPPHMAHQPPPMGMQQPHSEYMGGSSGQSSGVESPSTNRDDGVGGGASSGGMMIDPSLMETMSVGANDEGAVVGAAGGGIGGATNGDPDAPVCRFCKEQEFECGGKPPLACHNCARRQMTCVYDGHRASTTKKGMGKKSAPAAPPSVETTPSTRGKSKRTSEAGGVKKKQKVGTKKQQQQQAVAAAQAQAQHADQEGGGEGDEDVEMSGDDGDGARAEVDEMDS